MMAIAFHGRWQSKNLHTLAQLSKLHGRKKKSTFHSSFPEAPWGPARSDLYNRVFHLLNNIGRQSTVPWLSSDSPLQGYKVVAGWVVVSLGAGWISECWHKATWLLVTYLGCCGNHAYQYSCFLSKNLCLETPQIKGTRLQLDQVFKWSLPDWGLLSTTLLYWDDHSILFRLM